MQPADNWRLKADNQFVDEAICLFVDEGLLELRISKLGNK